MNERFFLEIVPAEERTDLQMLRFPVAGAITAAILIEKYLVDDYADATAQLHICRHGMADNSPCILQQWNGTEFVEVADD